MKLTNEIKVVLSWVALLAIIGVLIWYSISQRSRANVAESNLQSVTGIFAQKFTKDSTALVEKFNSDKVKADSSNSYAMVQLANISKTNKYYDKQIQALNNLPKSVIDHMADSIRTRIANRYHK